MPFTDDKSGDLVESGGLVLARCSKEWMDKRNAYYAQKAQAQTRSVSVRGRYGAEMEGVERMERSSREFKGTGALRDIQSFGSGE
jgi:hypothetical protein